MNTRIFKALWICLTISNAGMALAAPSQGVIAQNITDKSTFELGFTTDQALCRQEFPTQDQMRAELKEITMNDTTASTGVGGLAIRNESVRLINAYRYLVSYKAFPFKVQTDIDNWLLFKDSKCDKALCAAQTVFGSEDGVLYLYVAVKYGLVLSSLGFDRLQPPKPQDQLEFDAYFKIRPWNKRELAPYLKALPMLPHIGLPLPFTRMHHASGMNPVNPNVLSNGTILYYDSMDSMSDSEKEQTTYHEIAHNYGLYYGVDRSKEWLKASNWIVENGKFVNARPGEFVSGYASKDFFEDFAESFMYYRYYPRTLKEKSPARYEYLRAKIYGGREFISINDCK